MKINRNMASRRGIGEDIGGTFDVDVVGLTDLVDLKSDGELFYFESEEYGLFGEDDNPFPHSTSYTTNGEKETPTSSSLSPGTDKGLKISPPKIKKNKMWNEMEKDLFLKGLELFGKNWRKISKFMATKTSNQVKLYYQEWSETANVIPDAVNITNDTSIYLPLPIDNEDYLRKGLNQSSGNGRQGEGKMMDEHNTTLRNFVSSTYAHGCDGHLGTANIPMGEGMVVSSLHDWNLGSQVSVNGTEEELPYESSGGGNRTKKKSSNRQLKKNKINLGKVKKLTNIKSKKINRQAMSQMIKIPNNTYNIISEPKPRSIIEGQIIRLNKNDNEDDDVNIDDSDGGDDENDRKLVVCDEPNNNRSDHKKTYNDDADVDDEINGDDDINVDDNVNDEQIHLHNEGRILERLSVKEQEFCINLGRVKGVPISQYILIRDRIIQQWERMTPISVSPEHVTMPEFEPSLINDIFKYLEKNKVINNCGTLNSSSRLVKKQSRVIKVLPKRVKSRCVKDILDNEKFRSTVSKQGGGLTLSHDSSGAVIDALHIPEASNRKSSSSHNFQLKNYLKYNSDVPAPYQIVLYPQALIPLDLHSHSSLSEVIGLLGGFLDESEKVLHITLAIPTKSSSSKVDCEMCPLSQTEALQGIQNNGMKVVGWYHSHPTFHPNPSQRDLGTQAELQKWFKKSGVPFTGLIISSYNSFNTDQASQIRCFILDSKGNSCSSPIKSKAPYQLEWKIHNEFDIEWDNLESLIKNVLDKRNKRNAVKWKEEWIDGVSYLNKYISSLGLILPSSNQEVINLVKDFLFETL